MAEKQCSPATTLAAGIVFMLGGGAPAVSADKPVESKTLADGLFEVGCDENTWFRSAGLLAFSLEMGIPEERFRETHPGARRPRCWRHCVSMSGLLMPGAAASVTNAKPRSSKTICSAAARRRTPRKEPANRSQR